MSGRVGRLTTTENHIGSSVFDSRKNNNQPKDGICGGGYIGEGVRPRRNMLRRHFGIIWGGKLGDEEIIKMPFIGLRLPPNDNKNATTN